MRSPFPLRRFLVVPLLAALAAIAGTASVARADTSPFPVVESFQNATLTQPSEWDLGGDALLTAAGGGDPAGQGWLRLTSATEKQSGYIVNDTAFPSDHGIDVTFDYASYGGSGADGLTFFLYDGSTSSSSFAPGPNGGSLGYASCPSPSKGSAEAGLTNGVVGIGFDEYGNFDNTTFCGQDGSHAGLTPNTITVRGAAGANPSATGSYPYLTSVGAQGALNGNTRSEPLLVNVAIDPDQKLTVYITYANGTVQTVTSGYQLPSSQVPATLKFGWAASTGGSTDYHEIRNTTVAEPADLSTTVSGPVTATRGTAITYTATVTNAGQNAVPDAHLVATDPASGLSDVSWTCAGSGCPNASGIGLPDAIADLPVGATVTYTITGTTTVSTSEGTLRFEADPTGATAQSVPGVNIATATTEITPAQSGAGTGPSMTLANTDGYTGVATATQGTYTGGGVSIGDQWQHCDATGTNCTDIPGATGTSYTTGSADRGDTLRLAETATNAAGSTTEYTDATSLPDTSLSTADPAVTTSITAAFTLASPTAGAAFECRLDSGGWAACSSAPTFSGLADGTHTLQARAVYAGLSDPTPATHTWTVDTGTPVDTSDCGAPSGANGYYTSDPTCTVQGTDPLSGIDYVRYELDGGTTETTASGARVPITGDGTHTLRTEVVNLAGTASGWSTHTIRLQTNPPAAPTVTAPTDGSFIADNEPTLTASTDVGATVTFTLDGAAVGTATADGSGAARLALASALADGPHTVTATATDAAGLVSARSSADSFTVESAAPSAPTVLTPAAGSVSRDTAPTITVTGRADETVAVDVDGIDYGPVALDGAGQGSVTVPGPLADGQHTVRARETDRAGNVSVWSTSTSWTVKTSTDVALTGPTAGPTADTHPAVDYAGQPGDSYTITVDGATVATGVIPASGGGWLALPVTLRDGAHTITITATDAAGNAASHSIVVAVDTTAPLAPVTVGAAPADVSASHTAHFTFTEPAGGSGPYRYRCSLDAAAWTECTSPVTYTGLADGPHILLVDAVDSAGNISASTEYAWTVDTTPPSAPTILGGPARHTLPGDTTFRVSAAPDTTLSCSLDGRRYRPCPSAIKLRSLAVGSHVLRVRQTDEAGQASRPAVYRWTVLRRRGPRGLPRAARLLVAPRASSQGTGELATGCDLNAGSIRRCTVVAYAGERRIGSGTTREVHRGAVHTVVGVRLDERGRRLLARAAGGLKVRLRATVTPYGFDSLPAGNHTVLFRPLRFLLGDVLFAFDRSTLTPRADAILAQLADQLHDASEVVCVGNTDSIGSAAYNRKLGLRRARTACDALHRLGVHARLRWTSDGETRPAATNASAAGRHANRRVVLRVSWRDLG